jgi:Tfp pilus assembly major pilin PilA
MEEKMERSGPSVVEYLIVVVVAGLVAWVAIQNYTQGEIKKVEVVKQNMKILDQRLNKFAQLTNGFYPARVNTPVAAICADSMPDNRSIAGRLDPATGLDVRNDSLSLLPDDFSNPYNRDEIAVMTVVDSVTEPVPGIIYYIPFYISGNTADEYTIRAGGRKGLLKFEIRSTY